MLDKCITDKQCILDIVNKFLVDKPVYTDLSRERVTQIMLTRSLEYFDDMGFYPESPKLMDILVDIENNY